MRILLVEPNKAELTLGGEDVYLYEPLALEYLAAGLAPDHDVRILDLRLEAGFGALLEDWRPDLVGITSYTVHVNTVRRLFDQVKAWNPEALTVVGGHHATVAPQDFVWPSIDLLVLGEGVRALQEIVACFERGEGFDGIPGLAFGREGRLVRTATPEPLNLDALPFPDRRFTAAYRQQYASEWLRPLASMRTSKGCPFRCNFCALWKLTGGKYLTRQPERVVEELAGIEEENVFFADDESLIDAKRMERLALLLRDAGLKKRYFFYGRSDTIARNPDLMALWREVGLDRIFVGLEFCEDEHLADIGKGTTIQDNARAVEILNDLGIAIHASLIVRPDFGRQDFAALKQYCRDLDLEFAAFAMLTPLPGTDFYEQEKDRLLTHNYDFYDFLHTVLPTDMPLKEFYEEYARLYTGAISFKRQLSLLRRYPLRELPSLLALSLRFASRMRNAYQDYEEGDLDL